MDAGTLALTSALALEPEAAAPVAAPTEFRLVLELDAWLPRLAGDFTDDGANVDVSDADLHDAELSFAGALQIVRDRLSVGVRGFSFATDGGGEVTTPFTLGGLDFANGEQFSSSFSWWSVGVEVSYDFYRPLAQRPSSWSEPVAGWTPAANGADLSVYGLLALDITAMQRELSNETTALRTDANEAFFDVEIGIGFELSFDTKPSFPLVRRVSFNAEAAYGINSPMGDGDFGSASRLEADVSAWFCDEGAVFFGYRIVGGSFDGDELGLDGSVQGLRAGLKIEF